MRTRLLILPLITWSLAASSLAACSVQETTRDSTSAYTIDDNGTGGGPGSLDTTCTSMADTGDMYRYCMEYGPQQAMAVRRN